MPPPLHLPNNNNNNINNKKQKKGPSARLAGLTSVPMTRFRAKNKRAGEYKLRCSSVGGGAVWWMNNRSSTTPSARFSSSSVTRRKSISPRRPISSRSNRIDTILSSIGWTTNRGVVQHFSNVIEISSCDWRKLLTRLGIHFLSGFSSYNLFLTPADKEKPRDGGEKWKKRKEKIAFK